MTIPTRGDLAKLLATMPYGVLASVAKELVEMNQDPECNRHPETPVGMAETLYDWGEAYASEV
jgi:hypothetical protein